MSDEITEITETVEDTETVEPASPRWIYDLLRMDSYADMTDEEINMVVAWREDRAREQAEIEQLEALSASITEQRMEQAAAAAQTAKDNLSLICQLIGSNYQVGGDDFEPTKPQ